MTEIDILHKKILDAAHKSLDANKECYIALWALQNPDEDFSQWTLCYQPSWHSDNGVERFWMEKR
jgi:hypothetical protein